jgi:hypothetical protein
MNNVVSFVPETVYIVAGVMCAWGVLGIVHHFTRSREDRWIDRQLQMGRRPQDVADEVATRKMLVALKTQVSHEVINNGMTFGEALDTHLGPACRTLEKQSPRLGKKFLALVEQLDDSDLLVPEAMEKHRPSKKVRVTPSTPAEFAAWKAEQQEIDRAAFPD